MRGRRPRGGSCALLLFALTLLLGLFLCLPPGVPKREWQSIEEDAARPGVEASRLARWRTMRERSERNGGTP